VSAEQGTSDHQIGLAWPTWRGGFVWRLALAALAVAFCYQFDWTYLRFLTSEVVLNCWSGLGLPTKRIAFDTIELSNQRFHYGIGCSFADVFCASLPFLWDVKKSFGRNLLTIAGFGPALLLLNIVRALLTHAFCAAGLPLELPDWGLGGLAYLTVWRWLSQRLPSRTFTATKSRGLPRLAGGVAGASLPTR
jgi:hypothetical protein